MYRYTNTFSKIYLKYNLKNVKCILKLFESYFVFVFFLILSNR